MQPPCKYGAMKVSKSATSLCANHSKKIIASCSLISSIPFPILKGNLTFAKQPCLVLVSIISVPSISVAFRPPSSATRSQYSMIFSSPPHTSCLNFKASSMQRYGLASTVATNWNNSTNRPLAPCGKGLNIGAFSRRGTNPWDVGNEVLMRCWFLSGT